MWLAPTPPVPAVRKDGGFWYWCSDCDVYGFGKQCWSCRRRKILVRNVSVPGWTAFHRHNPTNTDGDCPSAGRVPFEGEVVSLV